MGSGRRKDPFVYYLRHPRSRFSSRQPATPVDLPLTTPSPDPSKWGWCCGQPAESRKGCVSTRAMIRASPHARAAGSIYGLSVWVDFRMHDSVLSCEEQGSKNLFCASRRFFWAEPGCHFSGRIFFHLGRNHAPRLKSLGAKKKLSLRPASAHTRTQTSSMK